MKKLVAIILVAAAVFTLGLNRPALAGDPGAGAAVFGANCIACHAGGGNVVGGPTKGLKIEQLKANGVDTLDKIITQVTKGKNAMPAFGRLGATNIENVAAYVLDQAENNKW